MSASMRQPLRTPPIGAAKSPESGSGFTLVEMLTVMAVILILVAVIGPAFTTIARGPLLTQASDEIVGLLNLAQQTAAARNQTVAVRFYQYADASAGESTTSADNGRYRAAQLFLVNEDGTVSPLRAVVTFPLGIIADSGATLSTLLTDSFVKKKWTPNDPTQPSIPRAGLKYNCCEFRFRPDGSTNLSPASNWFVTLHNNIDGDARSSPPPNYVTIQIDPINGTSSVYRP